MRRGGVLILLIGLILIVGAGALFLFFVPPPGPATTEGNALTPLATEDPGVEVVVAKVDIPASTLITDVTLLERRVVDTPEYDEKQHFTSISEVEGKLTVNAIEAGALIRKDDLTEPGLSQTIPTPEAGRPRDKAYPFIVTSQTGVGDQVKPGDFVDVVATFRVGRVVFLPITRRLEEQAGQQVPVIEREKSDGKDRTDLLDFGTTKTLVQRVQVLKILRPPVTVEATPEGGGEATTTDSTGAVIVPTQPAGGPTTLTPGEWTLLLAVNAQEAELLEFALSTDARLTLVLRGAGDTTFEPTIGATFDLLITEFGVPMPRPLEPRRISEEESLIYEPTLTPAPTRVP